MPASTSPLTIRAATMAASDDELLVDFVDSQIPWLSSVGSGGQWGTQPIRQANPTVAARSQAWITRSEHGGPWGRDWCRAFVAEARDDGGPVAGLVLDSASPAYVRAVVPEQDDADPFVYLAYLIANRRAAGQGKGCGATLIALAKEQARGVGVKRLCVDCWAGNDRKLVKYYESQGFVSLGDFTVAEKNDWPGCVLEMRL